MDGRRLVAGGAVVAMVVVATVAWVTLSPGWAVAAIDRVTTLQLGRHFTARGGAHLDFSPMAIRIEERYRGLRSPRKIKMAVSGCTRECAEAQSKDVGVIATEKGWNLYVAGNGGMKPRHAELLAGDVDDETLIKLIDRFLMFYIRTGDRLQRTSVWLENMEGGLDYLKSVVVDDKLGLGAELEAGMAAVIAAYQCEWKTTLEDPEQLKRFRQFVNSPQVDNSLAYVVERGQRRPATPDERKIALVSLED